MNFIFLYILQFFCHYLLKYDEDIKNTWHRKNDSFFSWRGVMHRFDLDSDQCHGGRLDRCYYVNDINSKQMDVAPKGNAFLLNIEFESKGSELKGICRWKKLNGDYRPCTGNEDRRTPDINWLNNKLEVMLVPKAHKGGIAFTVKNVEAKGEFQMNSICKIGSDICDRLFGYKKKIENGLEGAIKNKFNDNRTQDKLAEITRQGLSKLGVPAIKSLRLEEGDVVVEY
jgi:hypothetical protein